MTAAAPRKRVPAAERLPKIRLMVGNTPAKEIAATLGISVAQLYNICRKAGISLACERRLPSQPKVKEPQPASSAIEESLESAVRLLRNHGWTVIRPDPFLDLKRKQLQQQRTAS